MKTQEIADFLGAELIGDGDISIERVASLAKASAAELAFTDKPDGDLSTGASCILVPIDFAARSSITIIRIENPKLAFARVAKKLHASDVRSGIDPTAMISETASVGAAFVGGFVSIGDNSSVGDGCQIHPGVRIGNGVKIGESSVIHPNCVIYDNVEIGRDCVIHAGSVIGADGFGYVRDTNNYVKFPQIGTVVIEDNVEIGANSCIDRGALGETRIGEGTKIDNLVQIAHNVQIGKRVVIAAQTGISGSTVIEDDCVIAGQAGIADHVTLKSGVVIGARGVVFPGKIIRKGVWMGIPVQPLDEYKRQNAHVKGLQRLKDEVKQLREQIADLRKPD